MEDKVRLEKTILKAFKNHWTKIFINLKAGKPSLSKKRYRCFEADTVCRQKKLAEKFYGLKHAKKMIGLSEKEVLKDLSCYLPVAIQHALKEYDDEPEEQEEFMARLVEAEYVILDSKICHPILPENDDWEGWDVSEYPAEVLYDDWYERSFGSSFFVCGSSILAKSTGEPFLKTEVDWLIRAIIHNIDANDGDETLWGFVCEPLDKKRIWIYFFEIERDNYLEGLEELIEKLSKQQIVSLIQRMTIQFSEEEIFPIIEREFKNIGSKNYEDMISKVRKFIGRKKLDNQVLKGIERISLKLLDENDFMKYHYIEYYGE
jgi:hypothetical protein